MAITLRTQKGSELTYEEVDENFSSTIYSGSISGNTLTLHYTASEFSPSNLVLPIVSSSYAATSLITNAVTGSTGYIPQFESEKTLINSPMYSDGARISIGTETPNLAAVLDLESTKGGFLPPRMTTAQIEAIANPPEGLMVYNTEEYKVSVYASGSWRLLNYV